MKHQVEVKDQFPSRGVLSSTIRLAGAPELTLMTIAQVRWGVEGARRRARAARPRDPWAILLAGAEEQLRVWMLRLPVERIRTRLLDDLTVEHNHHAVAQVTNDFEIV